MLPPSLGKLNAVGDTVTFLLMALHEENLPTKPRLVGGRSWVPKITPSRCTTWELTGAAEEEEEDRGWHQGERQHPDVRPPCAVAAGRMGTKSHCCTAVLLEMGVQRRLSLKHADSSVIGNGRESLCPTEGHAGPANKFLPSTCWSSDQESQES